MRYLLSMIFLVFLLSSCSDDDPKESIPNESEMKDTSSRTYHQANTLQEVDPTSIQIEDETKYEEIEPIHQPVPAASKKKVTSYDDRRERIADGTIFTDGNTFVVQESSWQTKQRAESRANTLAKNGHETFVTIKKFPNGQTWYRVRIGYFNTLEEARKVKARL